VRVADGALAGDQIVAVLIGKLPKLLRDLKFVQSTGQISRAPPSAAGSGSAVHAIGRARVRFVVPGFVVALAVAAPMVLSSQVLAYLPTELAGAYDSEGVWEQLVRAIEGGAS